MTKNERIFYYFAYIERDDPDYPSQIFRTRAYVGRTFDEIADALREEVYGWWGDMMSELENIEVSGYEDDFIYGTNSCKVPDDFKPVWYKIVDDAIEGWRNRLKRYCADFNGVMNGTCCCDCLGIDEYDRYVLHFDYDKLIVLDNCIQETPR